METRQALFLVVGRSCDSHHANSFEKIVKVKNKSINHLRRDGVVMLTTEAGDSVAIMPKEGSWLSLL